MRKGLLLILIISMFIISCEMKVTEYIDIDKSDWKHIDAISSDQYINNFFISNDSLYYFTPTYRGSCDISSTYSTLWYTGGIDFYSRVHMNQNYSFAVSEDKQGIRIYTNDMNSNAAYLNINDQLYDYFRPCLYDSTFSSNIKVISSYLTKDCIASNGDKQFLFFFYNYANKQHESGTYYCLVDISAVYEGSYGDCEYSIENCKIVKLDECSPLGLVSPFYYQGKYHFNLDGNYVMDTEGNVAQSQLRYSYEDLFEYQDKLWALSARYFYYTTDGINWTNTNIRISNVGNFFEYEGKLYRYFTSWIYEVDLENMQIYQLDSKGLNNLTITAIKTYNDDVYISTLGGIYKKSKADFFKNKELISDKKNNSIQIERM